MPDLTAPTITALHAALGADGLLTDPAQCQPYGSDDSRRQAQPQAVALPTRVEQVQALVRICRAAQLPIVARGCGTATTGAAVPVAGGVVVSFERMDRILAIRPADRVAVVEPGVLNGALQEAVGAHGFFWPPDPTSSPSCSVGGNLACNAGGPRAVKYGATRDNVLGLAFVDGRGELIRCGAAVTKNASGYDLTHLLIGSEGTLGLIVEATLRLLPKPEDQRCLRALYRDTDAAAAAVARLMAQPVAPAMLEFMDAASVKLAREVGGANIPEAGAMLMIEVDGAAEMLDFASIALAQAAEGEGLLSLDIAPNETARAALWSARRALSPALRTIAPGKINEDVVVPVSAIPALVARVNEIGKAIDLPMVSFGHAGNGNLHVNILFDPADADQSARAQRGMHALFDAVLALDGQLSGEHGIGIAKREFMGKAYSPATLDLMRAIKAQFDPDGLLNPGKVVP
ncbi:MAG: FAD-binding protein [Proteobacteria bacterium]|nr:FAD-binding protein [Pseudomonadota bacterium]